MEVNCFFVEIQQRIIGNTIFSARKITQQLFLAILFVFNNVK